MRKTQVIAILLLVFLLVAYGIYVKLSEEFNFRFTFDSGPQFYSPDDPPDRIYLAGEVVPLEDKTIARRFAKELKNQTYWHPARAAMLDRANFWLPKMSEIFKQHGVPDDLKYLVVVETHLQNLVSNKGAVGYWQFIPPTAHLFGLEMNDEVDERYNPIMATHAACRYLKYAHGLFGNWTSAAASYNMGMAGMTNAMLRQRNDSFYKLHLNGQTTDYIFRVLAVKQLIEHPNEYGYKVSRYSSLNSSVRIVRVNASVPNLTAFARRHGITYQTLRMYNPWIKRNSLTIRKKGKVYTLLIPIRGKATLALDSPPVSIPATTSTSALIEKDTTVTSD